MPPLIVLLYVLALILADYHLLAGALLALVAFAFHVQGRIGE